eukprot:9389441-Lingulodinium_polyedra.AAC.1
MLAVRQWLQKLWTETGGCLVYPLVDSSPQRGRDYEMVVLNLVHGDLAQLHADIVQLEARKDLDVETRLASWEVEENCMDRIRQCITQHVAPPVQVGFGKGRSTLACKFQAVMHAVWLVAESSPALFAAFVKA